MDKEQVEKKENPQTEAPNDAEAKSKKKRSAIKYILNITLILTATALAVFFALKDNADKIFESLTHADVNYLLIILGLMLGCILIRSFILFCFAHLFTRKYHLHQAIAVDQIGEFYNAITPGASGGQIMQAYTYKKQGVQIASAVSILAMYSIVYQVVLIVFGTVSFIAKYDFITSLGYIETAIKINDVPLNLPIWPLTIIGFILNVGVIAVVFLMGYWHAFHNFIMGPVIGLLAKIKIVKHPDRMRENLRIQVENFKIEFRRLSTNVPFLILVVVSFTLYMITKFSIPYFVGKALGNQNADASFWDCIFLSNYHQMITGLIPIPGSAGVSEFVFYKLFMNERDLAAGFFIVYDAAGIPNLEATSTLARSALLLWRSSTFVIPIIIGGLVTAFYRSSPKNEATIQGEMPNRQTLYSLQQATYVERSNEVASLVETSKLSREAIIEKLKPKRKKKAAPRKKHVDRPANLEKQEYDTYELDDVEDDR
ncbi:MAG: flippase-like domain-containing protein [Bacilli bacterium]|nr:flippase-like domain-containing protein [Bacilli bacterium]